MFNRKSFVHLLLVAFLLSLHAIRVWAQDDGIDEEPADDTGADALREAPLFLNADEAIWTGSNEFRDILGVNPAITLAARKGVENPPVSLGPGIASVESIEQSSFAYEGGVWVPERNEGMPFCSSWRYDPEGP
jgi:hypothetical protein